MHFYYTQLSIGTLSRFSSTNMISDTDLCNAIVCIDVIGITNDSGLLEYQRQEKFILAWLDSGQVLAYRDPSAKPPKASRGDEQDKAGTETEAVECVLTVV